MTKNNRHMVLIYARANVPAFVPALFIDREIHRQMDVDYNAMLA